MAGIRTRNRLKALAVEKECTPGSYADGGGLSLIVTDTGAKKWELRIAVGGRRRQLGLGVYPGVSLEDARNKATHIRQGAGEGRDVVSEQRRAERVAAAAPRSITFRAAFDGYHPRSASRPYSAPATGYPNSCQGTRRSVPRALQGADGARRAHDSPQL